LIGPANAPAATPPRSVLFNNSPAPWDLGARERDLASLGQGAQSLGFSDLPISKSGQPIVPTRPQLSTAQEQALYAARLLSPNLVDYLTKTLPPPAPFPSAPGKIPSLDNPYAVLAALEAGTSLIPEARTPGMAASVVERGAAEAALERGSFSIADWSSYPTYVARPKGPFRLLEGQEYQEARNAADRADEYLHKVDPGTYEGMHIHEIHPVKFGGSPTDLTNKIALSPKDHYALNAWWRRLQSSVETAR
jgi:hypothetical protein